MTTLERLLLETLVFFIILFPLSFLVLRFLSRGERITELETELAKRAVEVAQRDRALTALEANLGEQTATLMDTKKLVRLQLLVIGEILGFSFDPQNPRMFINLCDAVDRVLMGFGVQIEEIFSLEERRDRDELGDDAKERLTMLLLSKESLLYMLGHLWNIANAAGLAVRRDRIDGTGVFLLPMSECLATAAMDGRTGLQPKFSVDPRAYWLLYNSKVRADRSWLSSLEAKVQPPEGEEAPEGSAVLAHSMIAVIK